MIERNCRAPALGLATLFALLLAGCAGPTSILSGVNVSGTTLPYPADYRETIAARFLAPNESAMISEPVEGTPWSMTEARGWYVCLLRSGGAVTAVYLGVDGKIGGAVEAPEYVCGPGTVYQTFARGPY